MAFNSIAYLVFYSTVLLISWLLVQLKLPKMRLLLILAASLYFYASSNFWLLFLLLGTTQVDYIAAQYMEDAASPRRRRMFLALSLISNLTVLSFFKYSNFLASSIVSVASIVGLHLDWVDIHIILPIGISFYTFESMSYTIDVYQHKLHAERRWWRWAFFVSFFPHLVAGPIVRPHDFLPQLDKPARLSEADLKQALQLIFRGVFKKLVLADFLATYANDAFRNPSSIGLVMALVGIYAFAYQIYFDFSGYTDVAIGCSKLMGFWLPDNFRRPYVAISISDFWRRWHISLSSWLRDYLYIPLGGGRMDSELGIYRNLMITMLLGGLWHGAAWHFVLWGGLQGVFLVAERHFGIGRKNHPAIYQGSSLWSRLVTFHLTCVSWIFFRAESTSAVWEYLKAFTRISQIPVITTGMAAALLICVLGGLAQMEGERIDLEHDFVRLPVVAQAFAYACVVALVVAIGSEQTVPFIYFQF